MGIISTCLLDAIDNYTIIVEDGTSKTSEINHCALWDWSYRTETTH